MCAVSVCGVHNRAIDEANRFMCGVGIHGTWLTRIVAHVYRARVCVCVSVYQLDVVLLTLESIAGIAEVRCREHTPHTRYLETCTSCSHTAPIILHSVNEIIFSTPVYWFFSLRMGKSTWKKSQIGAQNRTEQHKTHTHTQRYSSLKWNEKDRKNVCCSSRSSRISGNPIQNAELRHRYYYLPHHTLFFFCFTRSISQVLRFHGIWVLCKRTDARTIASFALRDVIHELNVQGDFLYCFAISYSINGNWF